MAYGTKPVLQVLFLALAQKDPTQAFKAATAVKMLSLAAATLERTQAIKLRALGLDRENAPPEEMPMRTFRDLSEDELKAYRERAEADEESELGIPIVPSDTDSDLASTIIDESDKIILEGDDIIVEGEEPEGPARPRPKFLNTLGGRLVRGNCPNFAWRFRVGGRDCAFDRSPIGFRSPGPLSALCSRGFFQGAITAQFRARPNPMRSGMPPSPPRVLPRSLYRQALAVHVLEIATKTSGDQAARRGST